MLVGIDYRGAGWFSPPNALARKRSAAATSRLADKRKSIVEPVESTARYKYTLLGGIVSVSTDEGIPAVADMIVRVLKHEEEADASSPTKAIPSTTKDGPPKKSADETDFTTGRPEAEITDQSAPDSKQLKRHHR